MNALKNIPWKFYGVWLLPLCSVMGVAVHGTSTYGWPVLFPVITKEFGWSAAVAATASSLARFEGGLEALIAGWIMDKYGPRSTYLGGGLLLGLGWIALSFVTADNILYYFVFFGIIVQTGANVGGYASGYKAVANWWIKWRARATAAFILPIGLAGTLSPMIVAALILSIGWRTTLLYMGIFALVLFIPAGIFIRPHKPERYGLLPDGDDPKKVKVEVSAKSAAEQALLAEAAKKQADFSVKDAFKSQAFWIYNIASIFYGFSFNAVNLFVPSQLVSRGFDLQTAAFFAGMMLSFSYVGRLTVFAFGDAISPKWLSIISWVVGAVGLFALASATPETSYLAWAYAAIYGSAYGITFTIVPVVKGWLFGRTNFGTISGIMTTISMVGSVLGPTFMGWIFDTNGTYYLGYMALGASYLIGAAIMLPLRRPVAKPVAASAPSAA